MSKNQAYNCSTCNLTFANEETYKIHYKSEHHRYNLKRKLISLPAISLQQYEAQFQHNSTKSVSHSELRCQICCKSFMSSNTYNQHLNSLKHKNNRKKMTENKNEKIIKKSNSSSQFSVISDQSHQLHSETTCLFCHKTWTAQHMEQHNFPPFKQNCIDLIGLTKYVRSIINQFSCVYCCLNFNSVEATKQHMIDTGHIHLNTDNFDEFEKFYLWTILEKQNQDEEYIVIESKQKTLQNINDQIAQKITITPIGAKIKDKLIGIRTFRKFYKQYYRQISNNARKTHLALTDCENSQTRLDQLTCLKSNHRNMKNIDLKKNLLNVYRKNKNY